jgi:hypothetical protein
MSPTSPDDSGMAPAHLLWTLAWANVTVHILGLVLAWFGMRPGSVVVPFAERTAYLAGRPPGWTWGWGVWMVCTLLLVAYMAALRLRAPRHSLAARLALVFTASGMAVDLLADAVQIQVLPLAAGTDAAGAVFLAFERLALTAGAATVGSGAFLALSGLLPSPELLAAATGPTIGFYSLWTLLVAHDLRRRPA